MKDLTDKEYEFLKNELGFDKKVISNLIKIKGESYVIELSNQINDLKLMDNAINIIKNKIMPM